MNNSKNYYLIGIGGIGMSAIAIILNKRGYKVSGSDRVESDMVLRLKMDGIEISIGHNSDNITDDVDVVVYTNAVSEDNPELVRAKQLGKRIYERAAMLDIITSSKYSIGVSGTHGKTSTTSMIAKIFLNTKFDPSLAIGGYIKDINGSGYEGKGKYFVYEACEAFGSMMHLHPNIAVITNVDNDHLDYYGSLSKVKEMFGRYIIENIPPYGLLIYNKDDDNLREVVEKAAPINSISVGIQQIDADFTADNVELYPYYSRFKVLQKGKNIGTFEINVPGLHNVYNALLSVVTAKINGIPIEIIQRSLTTFKNADRRFQLKLQRDDLTVIDDYAHHPSEIYATLSAAKKLSNKQNAQLIVIFQPHLYSRTQYFYKDFAKSLCQADKVILTGIYAAREKNINNISTMIIYDEIVKIIGEDKVIYSENLYEVPSKVKSLLSGNSVIITLGAGDVWKISEEFAHSN